MAKARQVFDVLYGYVFDSATHLQRACVDRKTSRIVNAVTGAVIPVEPQLAVWYTYRTVERALARLQSAGLSKDQLAEVTITQDLINLIEAPLVTSDHCYHMLTAGGERWLGRKFTPQEEKAYRQQAEGMVAYLDQKMPRAKTA